MSQFCFCNITYLSFLFILSKFSIILRIITLTLKIYVTLIFILFPHWFDIEIHKIALKEIKLFTNVFEWNL